jgi:L-lactate permease
MTAVWVQNYNPLQNQVLSTLVAALPIILLFACIGLFRLRIPLSAAISLVAALVVAMGINGMPASSALASALYGVAYGLFPIGWILLNVVFLYQLAVKRGHMDVLRQSLTSIAPDSRIQIILIAFAFGSFLEGMAGFGAPMAITSALLLQMGFRAIDAACLSLLGITASVAFGSLGIPVTTLEQVTGLNGLHLSAIVGRQLPFFPS